MINLSIPILQKNNKQPVNPNVILEPDDLAKLQNIQTIVKRTFKGIDVTRCGQPGNSNLVNSKNQRQQKNSQQQQDEDNMMTVFEMACKIKELEELKEIKSAHSRMTKVQSQLSTASS